MENMKLLDGDRRRERILEMLTDAPQPVSGSELSRRLGVSRQVVVQDIALLRATNKNILSTNKGYLLFEAGGTEKKCRRIFRVQHSTGQVLDEFYTIVDLGGKILDVVVEHDIYGQIAVDLVIANRQDAEEFVRKLQKSKTKTLKELTNDIHYHTVAAETEAILDIMEKALREKGYLKEEV